MEYVFLIKIIIMYSKVSSKEINYFKSVVGNNYVMTEESIIKEYSHDETEDLSFLPEVVIKPLKTKETALHASSADLNGISRVIDF